MRGLDTSSNAATYMVNPEIIEKLLLYGANPTLRDYVDEKLFLDAGEKSIVLK